jgi:iron-sulfur cluster repair protein YtfE (RIC family)
MEHQRNKLKILEYYYIIQEVECTTLSKSDFKLASSCAKKLVYKKQKYSSADSANEYLEMLAQGGYIVGKMATLYHPEGIEVSENNDTAKSETETFMQQENVVLFEPLFQSGQKLARVDILKKEGNKISIIEVKAKSFDSTNVKLKELTEYIEDVAFQHLIVSELYPNHQIESFLFMPDKSMRTSIDGLAGWFSIEPVR